MLTHKTNTVDTVRVPNAADNLELSLGGRGYLEDSILWSHLPLSRQNAKGPPDFQYFKEKKLLIVCYVCSITLAVTGRTKL